MVKAIDALFQRTRMIAQVIIAASLICIVYFALDRSPPYAFLSSEPAFGRAGETITLKAEVRRDVERHCSVAISRYVIGSNGVRFDVEQREMTAEVIEAINARAPNRLLLSLRIPADMAPGNAEMVSSLRYRCNKVHALWPIEVTQRIPFTVLPPL